MGSSNTDYSKQINTALSQANLPKSPLSQQYSNLFSSTAPGMMQALLNTQSLGNSFINSGSSPGAYNPPKPNGGATVLGLNIPPGTPTQPADRFNPNLSGGGGGYGGANSIGAPNIPGYTGGWNQNYTNVGGVDLTPYKGKSETFNDLIKQGVLTQDQVNQYMGTPNGFDPASNAGIQGDYQNWMHDWGQGQNISLQDWFNTYGPNGTNIDSYSPIDEQGFQTAIGNLNTQPNGGYVDPNTGQYIPPNTRSGLYLNNGQYTDQYGNLLGYSQPSSGGQPNQGNSGSGSVNVGPNGLPNGVNIPGFQGVFGGNLQSALAGLTNATGGAQGVASQIAGITPQMLQQLGMSGGANLNSNQTNLNPAISNLLQQTGQNPLALGQQDSQYMDNLTNIFNQQFTKELADTRERALTTGTNRSTGAGYEEAQLKAQALPQLAAILQGARTSEVGNQLTAQGQGGQLLQGLVGQQNTQQGLNLQNFFNAISANQAQQGLASQATSQNVGSQNTLASLVQALQQFNAGGQNQYNLAVGGMNQQAAQNSIQNQLSTLMSLFGQGTGMASQGIPGGSANVNIGNQVAQGSGLGGTLGGIGTLLAGLAKL